MRWRDGAAASRGGRRVIFSRVGPRLGMLRRWVEAEASPLGLLLAAGGIWAGRRCVWTFAETRLQSTASTNLHVVRPSDRGRFPDRWNLEGRRRTSFRGGFVWMLSEAFVEVAPRMRLGPGSGIWDISALELALSRGIGSSGKKGRAVSRGGDVTCKSGHGLSGPPRRGMKGLSRQARQATRAGGSVVFTQCGRHCLLGSSARAGRR